MADAKQRYTIIYYSEVLDTNAVQSPSQCKTDTLLIDLQADTATTNTSGIGSWAVTLYSTNAINTAFISFSNHK